MQESKTNLFEKIFQFLFLAFSHYLKMQIIKILHTSLKKKVLQKTTIAVPTATNSYIYKLILFHLFLKNKFSQMNHKMKGRRIK